MTAPNLLLHFDGANGSTAILDSSPNALTLTVNGSVALSTAASKFGNGSVYVPGGSGNYLSLASSSIFYFGTVDFTVDCWINVSGYPASAQSHVFSTKVVNGFGFYIKASGQLGVAQSGVVEILSTSATIPIGSWTHVAVTRVYGVSRLFINGLQIASYSPSITFDQSDIRIGSEGTETCFNGYIDELRINNGLGVWAGTFTPPMRPYTGADLLLHMDGANGSTSFIDSGDNSLTLTANGAAAISTAQSKFGGASGYFNGSSSSYASIANNPALDFGGNDFTIDLWTYIAANSPADPGGYRYAALLSCFTASYPQGWTLALTSDLTTTGLGIEFSQRNSTNTSLNAYSCSQTISQNAWHHFAVSKASGSIRLFIDGISLTVTPTTSGGGYSQANSLGAPVTIGGTTNPSYPLPLNGYIDEIRITNGVGLYTANFTPPVAPYGVGLAEISSVITTGQGRQAVSGGFALAFAATIATGNAQSISVSALEFIASASATSQFPGSVAVVGNLYYYVPTSTGQVYQSFAGSISSADLVLIHTAQAQSSVAFARIANPISVNTATSQSHQSISLSLIPFITSNSSTGQSNQSISSSSVFSYFGAGDAIRTKTTYTMGYVNRKWVMDKKRKLGGLSS